MTEDEAEEILEMDKEAMENTWSKNWDDDSAVDVQIFIFSDDSGAIGTTGQTFRDITLDSVKLLAISICILALFPVILLITPDWI